MIQIGNQYFQVKIIRKRNKNIYLRLKGNVIEITCPRRVSKNDILNFINEKSSWIIKNVKKAEEKKETSKLIIGEYIYYLGKRYNFVILKGRNSLTINGDDIVVRCKDGNVDNAINVFYKESKKTLLNLIEQYQTKYLAIIEDYGYDLLPDYKIRVLSSAWGINYTRKNQITINERLIHFEVECLKAVLWHELLHFVIPNHSKRFHEVLEYHMPEYKELMNRLH